MEVKLLGMAFISEGTFLLTKTPHIQNYTGLCKGKKQNQSEMLFLAPCLLQKDTPYFFHAAEQLEEPKLSTRLISTNSMGVK